MGLSLTTPPHAGKEAGASPWRRLLLIASLVRYRFFLYAGLLPYLLGAAWAYAAAGAFDAPAFWSGLGGIVLAVVGVESFNEYFDSQMGTDRVFNPDDLPAMSGWVLGLGIAAFAGALAVGIYLTYRGGWPILAFAVLGGLAAIFYVAPRSGGPIAGWENWLLLCRMGRGWCWGVSICTPRRSLGAHSGHPSFPDS